MQKPQKMPLKDAFQLNPNISSELIQLCKTYVDLSSLSADPKMLFLHRSIFRCRYIYLLFFICILKIRQVYLSNIIEIYLNLNKENFCICLGGDLLFITFFQPYFIPFLVNFYILKI